MKIQVFLQISVLKISKISVESTCVSGSLACNFVKKETPTQAFSCKIVRTLSSTEQLRWPRFKRNNSNKSVQRCFSDITYTQAISDNLQLSQ